MLKGLDEKSESQFEYAIFSKTFQGKNIRKRPLVEEEENEDGEGDGSVIYQEKASRKTISCTFQLDLQSPTRILESTVDLSKSSFSFRVLKGNLKFKMIEQQHFRNWRLSSKDARAIRERALKQAEEALKGKSK
ncbi:hypothetical protein HAX54_042437 [Datura stramonium]|uniref:Uncharacterized protein n=1 Tax=Datura stramonium TaxID=4076 RepID=A0ABS8W160_DATST|nr:hypothetical protein [Datura stramonium]